MRRTKEEKQDQDLAKIDAFLNMATGLGGCEDRGNANVVYNTRFRTREELQYQYKEGGLYKRIVDRPAMDAIREGFEIKGADKEFDSAEMNSDLEDLGLDSSLLEVAKWSRLFGGALLIPLVTDGKPMDEPLDMGTISDFKGFVVVDRWRATWHPQNPDFYQLSSTQKDAEGNTFSGPIHISRVIRFDGEALPFDLFQQNQYWGASVLESGWKDLRRVETVRGYMEDGTHNVTGMVFKIKGFTKKLLGAQNAKDSASAVQIIRQGIAALRNNWNNLHLLTLDSEDSIEQGGAKMTELHQLDSGFISAVVMDYDIPREILLHELKGALTSGESAGSIRLYYDGIASYQATTLTPAISRIASIYFAWKNNGKGAEPQKFVVEWAPLWQLTDEEKASIRKTNAETDEIYHRIAALESDEVRDARLVDGEMGQIEIVEEEPDAVPADLPEAIEGEAAEDLVSPEDSDPGTAFNGAQVQALSGIVLQVADGSIPFESGVQLIAISFPVSEVQALALLEPVREAGEEAVKKKAEAPELPAAMKAQQGAPPPPPPPPVEPAEVEEDEG